MVTETLFEDAFYYFQTSRNVALGEGSTSTGGIVHNGYHPLWMVLSSGAFALFPQDDLAAIRGLYYAKAVKEMKDRLFAELKRTGDPRVTGEGPDFDSFRYLGGAPKFPGGRKKK